MYSIFFISTIFEGIGAENQEKILKKKEEDMFQKIEGCLLESKVAYQDTALFIRPSRKIRYPPKMDESGGKGKLAVKAALA